MTKDYLLIGAGVLILVVVAALTLHEQHYRDRRQLIGDGRYKGLEERLAIVEGILIETRST